MAPDRLARALSRQQCDLLLAHIDGPRQVHVTEHVRTRKALILAGLIKGCDETGTPKFWKPVRWTMITERGRGVLSLILASYAEALVRAGCFDPMARPITLIPGSTAHIEDSMRRQPMLTDE